MEIIESTGVPHMNNKSPILAIALDAAELSLIERLCQEGKLPTLGSLMERLLWEAALQRKTP